MADSRSKNVSRNIIFAFTNKMVGFILPFIARTIILYLLGKNFLGIGSLFSSILSFLSMAELGLSSALVYTMYKPVVDQDEDKICALLSYYKWFHRRIGLVMLGLGTALMPFLPYLIKGDVPEGINVYILFYIYLMNSVISYFFAGYKQSILTAHQRSDLISKIKIGVEFSVEIGQIVVLVLFKNFYVYALVPMAGKILTNLMNEYVTNKLYPTLQCRGKISAEDRNAIRKRVSGLVGTKLNSIVVHSADMMVISAFLGLSDTAAYGNYYYILNAVSAFVALFFSSMTASVGNSIVTETLEKNLVLFKRIEFINAWISGWSAACLLCLYHPFMEFWTHGKTMYPIGVEILLTVYFFVYTVQKTMFLFKDASGIWYEDRFRPYACMILNVFFNIVLVQIIGIYGVVLSTIIAFAISIPWVNRTLFSALFKRSSIPNLMTIGYYILVTICVATVTYIVTAPICYGLKGILIRAVICVVLPNIMFLFFYGFKKEFKWLLDRFLKKKSLR